MYIALGEVKRLTGLSLSSLYRYLKSGRLIEHHRTPGGHRRFVVSDIERQFLGRESRTPAIYGRVSSHDQKDDLSRQMATLATHVPEEHAVYQDIGSGINFKKKGLQRLLGDVLQRKISIITVLYHDRLVRFAFPLIEMICRTMGTSIHVVHPQTKNPEEAMVDDVLTILTVFSSRLYGQRSAKHRKTAA